MPTPSQAERCPSLISAGTRLGEAHPFPPYFENVIAPAMLNTGATPEQINEIIRKETISCVTLHFNCFMPVPTFNRALRAAIFRAVRVPHESPLYFVVA